MGLSSNYATLTGNTCYNNGSGADNVLVGIYVANAAPENTISSNFFYGQSGSHRLAQDIQSPNGFTNITLCGNQDLNVVTQNGIGCGGGAGPGTGTTYAGTYWSGASTLGSSQDITVPAGASSAVVQSILTAAVAGQKIRFTGSYSACSLTLSVANVSLIGLDPDGASIQCATAGVPVLTISGAGDSIDSINLKHITNSPTCPGGNGTSTCGDGLQVAGGATRVKISNVHSNFNYNGFALGYTTYSEIVGSVTEFNNNHGIAFIMDATHKNMQWQVSRVLSEQNLGNGFDMTCPGGFTSVQTPGPYISGWTGAYGNAGHGFNFSCSAATTSGIADVWIDGAFASANNASGFYFDLGPNGGRNLIANSIYSEQSGLYTGTAGFASASQSATNVGFGIEITSSCDNTPAPILTGVNVWWNSYSGISASCPGTSITNAASYANGAALASAQTEAGVTINATNVQVNGGYHRKGSTQTYGIYEQSGDTPSIVGPVCDSSISAANCVFSGAAPTNGYQQFIGQAVHITGSGVPSMAAPEGSTYARTDSPNGGLYTRSNGAWALLGGVPWPSGGAGIPNYNGSFGWGTSYSAGNTIPANFVSTLNQNTTGTAANLTGCIGAAAGDICYYNGGWTRLAGNASGTKVLQETSAGVASWAAGSTAWNANTAPSGNLSLTMGSNTSIFNTTSAVSQFFAWKNTTAALVGASQSSPINSLCGTEWHSSASTEGCMAWQFVPGTGADAANTFSFTHTGSATGVTTTQFPGPVAAGASGSGVAGGLVSPEGTIISGIASNEILSADSANHCWNQNLNSSNKGCIPFSFTSPLVNTNGVLSLSAVALSGLATQGANTVVANVTGSTAVPTAASIPSGIQNYVAGTGYNQATGHQEGAALVCADTSGSGTVQVCNTSPTFSPAANDFIIYTTTTANTGTGLTINVNSLGAKSVAKWQTTTTLAANDIRANTEILMKYDGTNWEMDSIGNAPSCATCVTSAASLTSTALMTGAGLQASQNSLGHFYPRFQRQSCSGCGWVTRQRGHRHS